MANDRRFFVTGGTVPRDAACYVEREADRTLLESLLQGSFCYVLTSRQMGKSSLMVRAAAELREKGVACAVLDLTALGQNLSSKQWYDGLLNLVARQLDLEDELEEFWLTHARLGPMQTWMRAIREVVLNRIPGKIVLFVDEIDAVRSLPFPTDEFFAAIRECYNRRAEEPDLGRLTFCLLGVATPSDLIRDVRTTPFNIGRRIDLPDFTPREVEPLERGLGASTVGKTFMARILFWTGGHPYLTQRLCQAVAEAAAPTDGSGAPRPARPADVDRLCEKLFLSSAARERDDNLLLVRERLLRNGTDVAALLTLYEQVLRGGRVDDEEVDPLVSALKLSGIARVTGGRLEVRNRIYRHVFNRRWVRSNMPGAEVRRQRGAYRRGVMRALTFAAVVALAGYLLFAVTAGERVRQGLSATVTAKERLLEKQVARADQEAARAESRAADARAARRDADARAAEATQSAERAREAAQQASDAARRERAANRIAQDRLWDSYLAQARARRWSGRPGRRFDALDALAKAARINPTPELRDEAIACMALADLRPAGRAIACGELAPGVPAIPIFEEGLKRYAVSDSGGNMSIRFTADGREELRLPGFGVPGMLAQFSPDNRRLAVSYYALVGSTPAEHRLLLWDLRRRRATLSAVGMQGHSLDFSPDGRTMAVLKLNGPVVLYDTSSGRVLRRFGGGAYPSRVAFDTDGRRLAVSGTDEVTIYDSKTGQVATVLHNPDAVRGMDWSPDGRFLAAASGSHICWWDVAAGRMVADMPAHENYATEVAYSPAGRLLASTSWDGTVALWDASLHCLLVRALGGFKPFFSSDGRFLAAHLEGGKVGLWEVSEAPECRVLSAGSLIESAGFSRDGRMLVSAGDDGVRLWDVESARQLGYCPSQHAQSALFRPGGGLWVSGTDGLYLQPILGAGRKATLGGRTRVGNFSDLWHSSLSADGRVLATGSRDRLWVIRLGRKTAATQVLGSWLQPCVALSPDGRWVAAQASGSSTLGVTVWDARTGAAVRTLPTPVAHVAFSPDGRRLITASSSEYRFWSVGDWRPGLRIPRAPASDLTGVSAFTRDGKVLAIAYDRRTVRLLDAGTGRVLATLEAPNAQEIYWLCFSPDGQKLAVTSNVIHLWDLRLVRRRLRKMGLDWVSPGAGKPPERGRPHA